jgi:TonB family protein
LPPPPEQQVRVPAGEARGRVAISPDPNLTASNTAPPGVRSNTPPGPAPALGREADGTSAGGAKDTENKKDETKDVKAGPSDAPASAPRGTPGTAAEQPGRGGTIAANPPAPTPNPFSGITVLGGRVEPSLPRTGTTGVTPGIITFSQPGTPPPAATPYNLTITATAASGGGLPDFGVFANEQVYTVYIDMRPTPVSPSRSWALQYSVGPAKGQTGLVPPFPVVKELPQFPADLMQKFPQRQVVVFGTIDTNGKLQQLSVKQSPDPLLNAPVLAALAKWTFRPAQVEGQPVPAKFLLGVPVAP